MLLVAGIFSCGGKQSKDAPAEQLTAVTYLASDEKFPNPERGFYRYTESRAGANSALLDGNTLKSYRQQGITLIYRIYYLKDFKDKPISGQALERMNTDMDILRAAGLKCVLRFAYSSAENEADAPLDVVLQHLDQLEAVFDKNADVIAVLQAGFIGAWGEWYYSSNNLKTAGIRATILNKMLDVLPARRMIQVRTPAYKTEYLQNNAALKRSEAFSETKAARIGHHNDCFMASATDYGTYANIETEKAYIGSEGVYLPVGGETCPPDGVDPADCQKAENEMRTLHWSFLNEDYYKGVNDRWVTLGCMDNIIRELGYRFELISGAYSPEAAPGGTMTVELTVNNTGYSAPYNPRAMEIILKNSATGEIFAVQVDEDPRFWKPKTYAEIKFSPGIPEDMPTGAYDLYLNLPDPESLLHDRPEYSIRLANKELWDAQTGYNRLNHRINVGGVAAVPYTGNRWFEKKSNFLNK
ncbi:MAG: DUF4832 domain-containing protein [Bacteroidales bacterium]|nr:DUF4832 domain-containing protein [Bacteroidales bacterium]